MSNVKYHNVIPITYNEKKKEKLSIIIQYHHDTPAGPSKHKSESGPLYPPSDNKIRGSVLFHAMLSLTSCSGRPRACIRKVQTRHRHPPFSCTVSVSSSSSSVSPRTRNCGRRIIASSVAHTQSSASDPTTSAINRKGVVGLGVGVELPSASRTCAVSLSLSLKGACMHVEEGMPLFCGVQLPSRHWNWLCGGRRAVVAGSGRRVGLSRSCR